VTQAGNARLIGTIASLRVMDVSKRAGVENLKSYLDVEVESVDPAELRDRIGARAALVTDGEVALAVGTRVEIETHVGAAGPNRLPIYRMASLAAGPPGAAGS